jgi:molecular chaperone Hsp33
MNTKDRLLRIYCPELKLRIYAADTLTAAADIIKIHEATPNAAWALGRSITAASLLSGNLKPQSGQSIALKFSGSGPLKEVSVQADASGNIRGYTANPQVDITDPADSISFSKSIGAGFLSVTKELGMKTPYTGVVPLLYGEVAMDTAAYLTESEQVPSALVIGFSMNTDGAVIASGGILIQTMPDTNEEAIAFMEEVLTAGIIPVGERLAAGTGLIEIVTGFTGGREIDVMSELELRAACSCSRNIIASALSGVSVSELRDMIEKDNGAEASCLFCCKLYHFSAEDLEAIISKKNESNGNVH